MPDEALHAWINTHFASVGTHLYGRRMYDPMDYRETAPLDAAEPQPVLDWTRQWQAAENVVYSRPLAEPRSRRTRIERELDPRPSAAERTGAPRSIRGAAHARYGTRQDPGTSLSSAPAAPQLLPS